MFRLLVFFIGFYILFLLLLRFAADISITIDINRSSVLSCPALYVCMHVCISI